MQKYSLVILSDWDMLQHFTSLLSLPRMFHRWWSSRAVLLAEGEAAISLQLDCSYTVVMMISDDLFHKRFLVLGMLLSNARSEEFPQIRIEHVYMCIFKNSSNMWNHFKNYPTNPKYFNCTGLEWPVIIFVRLPNGYFRKSDENM